MQPTTEEVANAVRQLDERLERQAVMIEAILASNWDPSIRRKVERALVDWETERAGGAGD